MADLMKMVSSALSGAGYATGDASPGRIMPEITGPVIALNLETVDTGKCQMKIRVTVVSPVSLGAKVCEDNALAVCRILRDLGGECGLEPCKLNAKTELFNVAVLATFQGDVLRQDWRADQVCRVRFGSVFLDKILSFSAWRETDETALTLDEAVWYFRVEEKMNAIGDVQLPAEPFQLTVSFESTQEVYSGCTLTLEKREFANGYLKVIREGTAEERTIVA